MNETKVIVISIILIIIFIILKKRNSFSKENVSSTNQENIVLDELNVILDNIIYHKIEDMYLFYIDNEILIENNKIFYLSNKIKTELQLEDFLNNNNIIYKFFNIDESEDFVFKQNENVILILFKNLDLLFLIDSLGVYVLENSKEIKNINFKFNNKKIKKNDLIDFLNKEEL